MQMNDTVTVKFTGAGQDREWDYSVVEYAKYILSRPDGAVYNSKIKDLVASMVNYGAAMQKLNGENEGLANEFLGEMDGENYIYGDYSSNASDKMSEAIAALGNTDYAYSNVWYQNAESPVVFGSASLVVSDTTTIRLYFSEHSDSDKYSYTVSYTQGSASGSKFEHEVEIDKESVVDKGYVEITGIPSGDFNQVFRIAVRNNETQTNIATCEMTVLTYADILYRSETADADAKALAAAIIWYGMASVSYFK